LFAGDVRKPRAKAGAMAEKAVLTRLGRFVGKNCGDRPGCCCATLEQLVRFAATGQNSRRCTTKTKLAFKTLQ
jgi:hypothetical protein